MDDQDGSGYGKPPKKHQFKKGQSGNPKGRPKGSRNLHTLLQEALLRKQVSMLDGKTKTTLECAVDCTSMVMQRGDAAAGRAASHLIDLAFKLTPQPDEHAENKPYYDSNGEWIVPI